jgi:glycosyltransferase involved in cell wall biosynthesis
MTEDTNYYSPSDGRRAGRRVLLMSTGAGIGGEESFTTSLAEALCERNWDVRVAACGTPHIEELKRRGLRVESLPVASKKITGMCRGAIALARYTREESIDIVHAQSAGPAVVSILARCLQPFHKRLPAILWHDHGIVKYRMMSRIFNWLDMSIANSEFEREKLIANGLHPNKVVRIHNGVDAKRLLKASEVSQRRAKIRYDLGFEEDTPVVGFVGRLSPEKAPDDFIESFRYARKLMPQIRYLIVGDGVMRAHLEKLIRDLDASREIIMTGFRRDVPDLMCAMDVLALVSHMETFSLTTLEAMTMRLPCVVTSVGGNPEQVTDGENGHVVPDRTPSAIAEAVVDVLSDPAKKQTFGDAGFERVRSYFNRERMVAQIEDVYEVVCRSRR